jgi:alpha-L-fucosidase
MMTREREQLRELLTHYGKIDMLCLDVRFGAETWPEERETVKELRRLQPQLMLRNRGIGNYGDYYTPERVVPGEASQSNMPWMVIYPLGTNFSWEGDAAKYKGAKWVVDNLVDSVAKGGNFMVGIGPDGNGRFHPTAIAQLEEVGAWLKVNGEGIFNTHARPGDGWKEGETVRMTAGDDGKSVYVFLLNRPNGPVTLRNVQPAAGSTVALLGSEAPIAWHATDGGTQFDFPASAPTSLAYVLKVTAEP